MRKPTLLYAEDDKESRENYTFILQENFSEIYQAGDGGEALFLYHNEHPDIVMLDISMPVKNGLEVAKEIRKNDHTTPIIMLTAHSDKERLLTAVNLQLSAYLLKPVDDAELRHTLETLNLAIEEKQSSFFKLKGGLAYESGKRRLFNPRDEEIQLTKKEQLLLDVLCSEVGKFISHDEIIYRVWNDEMPDYRHNKKLTQLVYRLNKKIATSVSPEVQLVENGYSLGYRVTLPES